MPFKQTYYTSCQNGLRGAKGFQINAASEGIDAPALQEIERLGLYVPPVSAPSRPTPEEIQNFPISLLFQRLNDGAAILAQARYIGFDYSGRYGNYFTHSLISSDPERELKAQGVLPIELWGAHSWTTTESATTSLPTLNQLETAGIVHQESVIEFLIQNGRMEIVPAFLTAVEQALLTGRRIVLVENSESVAMWISAASYVLPRHLTLKLTFNTYVKNPYVNDFLIVGTTTDSDFGFASHEVNHQFFVFDFESKRFTPITDFTSFAQLMTAVIKLGRARMVHQFSGFVEHVAPDLKVEELAPALACYLFSSQQPIVRQPGSDLDRLLNVVVCDTMAWCAGRLATLGVNTLKATIDSVVERCPNSAKLLEPYTDLYNSSLLGTVPADIRTAIESPYLEYLIRQASLDVPVSNLNGVADRLRVDLPLRNGSNALMLSWVNRLRQCDEIERIPALFKMGDKLGFLDTPDDVLLVLGEELIGPRLAHPAVTGVVVAYVSRPGMKSIITGVASHLETMIGNPEVFRFYAPALSNDEIYKALARHAFAQQSLALFFRLVGARVSDRAIAPQPRLDAFEECIEAIKALLKTIPDDLVDNAFDAIWQTLPIASEATQILDLLERYQLKNSGIPRRLADSIQMWPLTDLQPAQQQLLERLGARGMFYQQLGDKQALVNIYRIPAELEISGEFLADEIRASIQYLAQQRILGTALIAQASSVIGKYLTQIKEKEVHAELLLYGYRHLDDQALLGSYLAALKSAISDHSSTRAKVAARFIRVANTLSKQSGNMISARIFQTLLYDAGKAWRSKELEQISKELFDTPSIERDWLIRVNEARAKASSSGVLSKITGFFGKRD
ncbi:MAG TPA: hypothetical protein VFS76_01850 [Pyrinomonadaceae bacterium]|nr:hypothetical protein [Pyrinomonadaceae bacterium]